jgi:bifunctional non-homologous end joining protein LigD
VASVVSSLKGAVKRTMPETIHTMLAISIEKPFDNPEWLFEIKWDGYRAVAFIQKGQTRLVSRTQNDLTNEFPELHDLGTYLRAQNAILDGEVVALDDEGRPSFSLMQQRTGLRGPHKRTTRRTDLPILYYVFDLLYVEGYDVRRVSLEERKKVLETIVIPGETMRYSDHYPGQGIALFEAAKQKGLEGILAKRAGSCYEERRSREWLKIKITQTVDCVVGGYIDPEGSRQHFGSLILGLYNKKGQLIHVGNAGTGFNQNTLKQVFEQLHAREIKSSPFSGVVDLKKTHWVKPELVAEIKFSEWTHETSDGGLKLRAPVYMGLRNDKDPKECTFEQAPEESLAPA